MSTKERDYDRRLDEVDIQDGFKDSDDEELEDNTNDNNQKNQNSDPYINRSNRTSSNNSIRDIVNKTSYRKTALDTSSAIEESSTPVMSVDRPVDDIMASNYVDAKGWAPVAPAAWGVNPEVCSKKSLSLSPMACKYLGRPIKLP